MLLEASAHPANEVLREIGLHQSDRTTLDLRGGAKWGPPGVFLSDASSGCHEIKLPGQPRMRGLWQCDAVLPIPVPCDLISDFVPSSPGLPPDSFHSHPPPPIPFCFSRPESFLLRVDDDSGHRNSSHPCVRVVSQTGTLFLQPLRLDLAHGTLANSGLAGP